MKMTDQGFNPDRLVLARIVRGMSKIECADALGVTARTLANYESGRRVPDIALVSKVLRFRDSFFLRSSIGVPPRTAASFRAVARMSSRERDRALGLAGLGLELYAWIDRQFALPSPSLPSLPSERPELAAEGVRAAWRLGHDTIPNLIHLIESHGVRVLALPSASPDTDGVSMWHDGIPFMFLNTSKSGERSRFDAAHELGHLILHQHGSPIGRDAETEANQFASAFLMPADVMHRMIGVRPVTLSLVFALKRHLKVSAMALVFRLQRLGMVTDWHARSLFQQLSARGFRGGEPGGIPREGSQLLSKVIAMLNAEGIRYTKIAEELGWTANDLYGMLEGLVPVPTTMLRVEGPAEIETATEAAPSEPLRLVR